jgi:alkylated DNA repair dioxygenase AlkB
MKSSNKAKQKPLTNFFSGETPRKRPREEESRFGNCPLCNKSFPWHTLESHAATCNGPEAIKPQSNPALVTSVIQPTSQPLPGLYLYHDFITEQEEELISQQLDNEPNLPWKPARFNGKNMGKRWGVHCNLRDRRVDAAEHPLPDWFQTILLPKLKHLPPMKGCVPNEANAIEYRRSQGHWLQSHVDDRKLSKEPIANISIIGNCYMTYTNQAMNRNVAASKERVWLPRRCLQILTGTARYDFAHGIDHADLVSDRRVSMTMRESPLTASSKMTATTTLRTLVSKASPGTTTTTTTPTTTKAPTVAQATTTPPTHKRQVVVNPYLKTKV